MHALFQFTCESHRAFRWAFALLPALWFCTLKVVASGVEFSLLHGFPTNSYPQSRLVFGEDGMLYGTTQMGGNFHYGSVFRISADGAFTNLFSFGRTNGAYPYSGLVKGGNGHFYGTAQNYGPEGFGTVFRFSTDGNLETLFSFSETNGAYPKGTLMPGKDGALYGTTFGGGASGLGTVFRITTNGDFTLLSSFGGTNGAYPFGGLVQAQDGAFYGATRHGGNFDGFTGFGTIYCVSAAGQLTTLYALEGYGDAYPFSELVQMVDGWLYGVTYTSVFRVSTNGIFQRIGYNPIDPLLPRSSLMCGNDGALYGMENDHVFRITTNGVVMRLWPFYNFWNGADPRAGLVQAPDTSFFGTTAQGGPYGGGVVFRVQLNTFFYPLTRTTNGWELIFAALAGNSYGILRSTSASGPWEPVANVVTDEYGVGRWTDTWIQGSALYRLSFPERHLAFWHCRLSPWRTVAFQQRTNTSLLRLRTRLIKRDMSRSYECSHEEFMTDILNKTIVLVLNRNWQAINVRTPQEAFCMMATNVATALDIELGDDARAEALRPVTWEEWITLPIRPQDNAVHTARSVIRVPTVIVAVNYARVPKKRPKLSARTIRERDGNRCQYTGKLLEPDEGSLDHVLPRSRGGRDTWENLVWSSKDVNARKGNRLPHEAGLKLLSIPRAPKELPVTALLRNAHGVAEWKLFLHECTKR